MSVYLDAAQSLLECYRTALQVRANPPAKISLRHGADVTPQLGTQEDECCSGVAWVRIVTVERLRDFADPNSMCAGAERRLTLEMGAASCLPFGTVENPITADQWDAVAAQQDVYHDAMESALCCAYEDLTESLGHAAYAGVYEPGGPDGNCVSGTMQVIVETSCGCSRTGG